MVVVWCGMVWRAVAWRGGLVLEGEGAVVVEGVQVADGGGKGKYTLAVVTVVEVAAKHVGGGRGGRRGGGRGETMG